MDTNLIKSLKTGDEKAFEVVFKTYYPRLCMYAFRYTKQFETAEDIVKDFFVAFWNNREKLDIKISLPGYLFRSVRNACLNFLDRDSRRKKICSIEEINSFRQQLPGTRFRRLSFGRFNDKRVGETNTS